MKKLIFSMLAMAAMVSCSNEGDPINEVNPPVDGEKVEIKLGSSISGVQTKSPLDNFKENDKIGIVAVAHENNTAVVWLADGSGYHMNNIEGLIGNDNKAIGFENDAKYYYPTANELNIYAYYPHSATLTYSAGSAPTTGITINSDPTAQIDYLYATPLTDLTRISDEQKLVFKHILARLDINVVKASGITDVVNITNIAISSDKSTANFDITAGTISNDGGSAVECTQVISSTALETTATTPLASFMLLPSGSLSDLEITIDGKAYKIAAPSLTLTAGSKTTFTVTFNQKDLKITDTEISAWGDGGNGTGEI